ncbi:unnamed protein product [Wuchereria bancrofti]|uniref:Uncharacterized protein n=1 Tax=Wuchereria bancrofti TaxID=6293 RepID=A0A3P7FW27_WUCBA|nr:unnamed protein product [Wuchereria bancrofti]
MQLFITATGRIIHERVPAQRPSKLSGAAGLSPGGGQHFAHILQTLEGLLTTSQGNALYRVLSNHDVKYFGDSGHFLMCLVLCVSGNSSQTAAQSFGMTNARGPNSSATPSATASSGVLMVGPNFKV